LTGAASLDLAIKVENNLNINASEGVVRLILNYTRTQMEPSLEERPASLPKADELYVSANTNGEAKRWLKPVLSFLVP
tara:strand:- start:726 stop:959 length:234 start_codon:yes stop_codon:yes gene_type:complete